MLEEDIRRADEEEEPLVQKNYEGEVLCPDSSIKIELDHVTFKKCRFTACDFSGSMFYHVKFLNCDFSNCRFQSCYFKDTEILGCKGDGGDFSQSTFRRTLIEEGCYHYANYEGTLWDSCRLRGCDFCEAFLAEVKFKKVKFEKVNLSKTDFFKTKLDGIDLSDSNIEGIMISDSFRELYGLKISPWQAMDLVRFLGVKII
ncbi:pentapeptide repeat-containing protein [Anaerostipes sp.]|uniref:pentapeptide repeat-containing protein n=1 Tax=Anaerostipes sp. TaxID=1872530 RepID=UPI0025C614EC|nr:pentapeptide repeat-containing protein [Anaerostipes sp.]MBS7009702.1 pentapeptide repeat-containing protein [Anaerostipes sp.]